MSIIGTDRADTGMSNHIDTVPAARLRHAARQENEPAIERNTVTLDSIPAPQKRTVASGLTDAMYTASGNSMRPSAIIGDLALAQTESALTAQLSSADTQINRLLQRQPDFQSITCTTLRAALNLAFPALHQPIDLDDIYVTTYVNEIVVLPGDDAVPQRRPTSSMTLRQALQNTISSGHAPQYDSQQTGFFYAAGNAVNNPAEVVPGMHMTAHVATFADVLQRVADNSSTTYQKACRDFWNRPDPASAAGLTPKAQLISAYRQQRLAESRLRAADNTLTASGEQLLRRACITDNPQAIRNSLGMFSIALRSDTAATAIPMAGISVLTRSANETPDTTSGPVLLTIPGQGLMEFSSSAEYRAKLQQWFDDRGQRAILLRYVAQQDRDHAEDSRNSVRYDTPFQYDVISTPLIADRIQSLLDQQDLDMTDTFNAARRQRREPDAGLDKVRDLKPAFDMADMQTTRQELLVTQFLQNASADDIANWRLDLQQYLAVLQNTQTSGLPLMRQYFDPAFLNVYARDKVRAQVKHDLDFDLDPDQVIVTTQTYFEHRPPIPNPTTIRKVPFQRTLTALALANASQLGDAGWNELAVKDSDGYTVPHMTHDYLSGMLRNIDIGHRYQELLQTHLLDSDEARAREKQYMQFLAARLQLDSREAKIKGDISEDSMCWVRAVLKRTPTILNGQALQARQPSLNGKPLGNILLFGTQAPVLAGHAPQFSTPISQGYRHHLSSQTPFRNTGTSKVVLYTPDAPDGKRLREFASRVEMKRSFIQNPAMRDYLLQQLGRSRQAAVSSGLANGNIDVSDSAIAGNFLQASYRMQAQRIMADADARTNSNAEDDAQGRWDKINLALDIAGIFLPPKVTIPLSLLRAAASFSGINEALEDDRKEDAWQAFFEGLAHLGGAALDGTGASTGSSSRLSKSGQPLPAGTKSALLPTSTQSAVPVSSAIPTGMSSVQIDGATYHYWNSTQNTVSYRNLFQSDPNSPGQLKPAGFGAPDANNVWKKISLRGGGNDVQSFLAGIAPIAANRQVQNLVRKIQGPRGGISYLSATIAGSPQRLAYDFENNCFLDPSGRHAARYFPRYNEMQILKPNVRRTVSNADREASLRALGYNLKLPLNFNPAEPANTAPIPRVIHSVWVGGKIPQAHQDRILASLENNATMAKTGREPYEMKLYLDKAAYASNIDAIVSKAPAVTVLKLEEAPFYKHFQQSKYFGQYMASIEGNGGVASNYSSATDVLRYRLLHHEGGLYMDCDDTLMAPPGSIAIKTTPTGLALDEPVFNGMLGMDMEYNTSIFGSQKGNPTLDAMSEESYRRFLEKRSLYTDPRPRRFSEEQLHGKSYMEKHANEERLYAYMQEISYVTGPNVFNHVIAEKLPEMGQLREAVRLKEHTWNVRLPASMRTNITAWAETRLPLGQINVMGSANTWDASRR